jgi:hypothetical protein
MLAMEKYSIVYKKEITGNKIVQLFDAFFLECRNKITLKLQFT